MGISQSQMIRNALRDRPNATGEYVRVPKHPRYIFCPETDWLYSTKFDQCDYYPLQRRDPTEWNEWFDGWQVTDDGKKVKLSIDYLRTLKETEKMSLIQNNPTTNAADYKGKFLVGSINKSSGAVSFSTIPARQPNREVAKAEAARLAQSDKSKMFVVVQVLDIASVQDVVFL